MVKKYNAYHKLDANITSLNAQTGQYYYDLKNGNIGKVDEIYRKIEVGDINNASLLNNQIAPVNSIEHYRKWVNAVYFDYIVPQLSVPQNIIDDLETLAFSSPFDNEDAVYTARAIVGYIDPDVNPKNLKQENDANNSSEIAAKVYLNPANDKLFIEIKGTGDEKLNFVIMNSLGVKLKEVSLNKNTVIDVSRLSNGLYFYQILRTFNQEIKDKGV
ncbi:MAG TPA: T9SS type A sorting domain-containing protein [Bacteroidales bacterium]|nr:T9SS type A sorting domain-containing protein [Bacteroidales bacterium]HQN15960.1 T9SS type A sorting domain-containing protein [Bacteroidales bacterium]